MLHLCTVQHNACISIHNASAIDRYSPVLITGVPGILRILVTSRIWRLCTFFLCRGTRNHVVKPADIVTSSTVIASSIFRHEDVHHENATTSLAAESYRMSVCVR
jgi:hypothetical protein